MVASNTLLQLVAHLQHDASVARGRHILLDYARKSSGARLALLFVLDKKSQSLRLLERSGRRPRPGDHKGSPFTEEPPRDTEIPLHGLFGAALHTQGFLHVHDIYSDPRSLAEEQSWTWRGGYVLLSAIGVQQRGALVLCFGPEQAEIQLSALAEGNLLICISLLSAYLSRMNGHDADVDQEIDKDVRGGEVPGEPLWLPAVEGQTVAATESPAYQNNALDDMLQKVSALYEMGLLANTALDAHELHQHMLAHLCAAIHAPGGCLWLYHPSQHAFTLAAAQGDDTAVIAAVGNKLERLISEFGGESGKDVRADKSAVGAINRPLREGPREPVGADLSRPPPIYRPSWEGMVPIITSNNHTVLLNPLRCEGQLVGAVALAIAAENAVAAGEQWLFAAVCDVAALVLRNHALRVSERQAVVDEERWRIARDFHDGAAQNIAHVVHKLEFIGRTYERQPQVALRELGRARDVLADSLKDLRYGLLSLVPAQLEQQGLEGALRTLVDESRLNEPGLKVAYEIEHLDLWPPSLEVPIYRFVQEALHNVRKHAHASQVTIRVRTFAGLLVAEVSDNGVGFAVEQARNLAAVSSVGRVGGLRYAGLESGLGLRTMQGRVQQAGGMLEIISKPGQGTTLKARFPLNEPSAVLTRREREVLRLLVEGATNRVIAQNLSVSVETVKSHVHHIMQKMRVKDRTLAAVVATKQGWL